MRRTTSITIRTAKSSLQPHHAQPSLNVFVLNGDRFYFTAQGAYGDTAQMWMSKNQCRQLARWLGLHMDAEEAGR